MISEILIYIIFIVVLLIAMMCEKVFFDINPIIWLVGGLIALILGIANKGIVLAYESIGALGVVFVLSLLFYGKLRNIIGGGIIKSFWMCSVFLGRYTVLAIVIFSIIFLVGKSIFHLKNREKLPGEELVNGMPMVSIANVITLVIIYYKDLFFT